MGYFLSSFSSSSLVFWSKVMLNRSNECVYQEKLHRVADMMLINEMKTIQ